MVGQHYLYIFLAVCLLSLAAPARGIDTTQVYYEPLLQHYLWYAGTAYCDSGPIMNWTCNMCLDQPEHFTPVAAFWNQSSQIFGYMGVVLNVNPVKSTIIARNLTHILVVVISFRGTAGPDLENWIENLDGSHTVPYPYFQNASVHSGFYGAFRSLQPQVFPVLLEQLALYPDAEIALTGHSLGGALATICLAQIVFELPGSIPTNISLYTFGSPRVGDSGFAYLVNSLVSQSFRVVHYRDIVPHLPPKDIGFLHVAQEIWYPAENTSQYINCTMVGEDPKCSDSLWLALSVYDHLHYLMGQPISYCTDTLQAHRHKKPHYKDINLNRTWNLPKPSDPGKPEVQAHKGQGWRPANAQTRK